MKTLSKTEIRAIYKQNAILEKTIELCAHYGFHGTSMDRITAETQVSKATIYKYFESKEKLIAEALKKCAKEGLKALNELFTEEDYTLKDKLIARFTDFQNRTIYNGCYFQLAYYEYANTQHDNIAQIAQKYKSDVITLVAQLLEQEGIPDAAQRALRGEMIFFGLMDSLQILKAKELIDTAQKLYLEIIFEEN